MRQTADRQRQQLQNWLVVALLLAAVPGGTRSVWAEDAKPSRVTLETGELKLARNGQALQPVIVGENASEEVRASAGELARMLSRITGGKFSVKTGDGNSGIAVGQLGDFPAASTRLPGAPDDPTRREDYLLLTHTQGMLVIGRTPQAVSHAVWDLLWRLGYRQFFPGETWEVVPHLPDASVEAFAFQQPHYLARRIWYGFGAWDYAAEPYRQWCLRNRATSAIELNTGHSYDGILARNREEFEKHPEYLGLVNGERKSTKFCISNPGLRKLVVQDALARMAATPTPDSISIDPSDGLNWCECEDCRRLGSVSDQAVTLANAVAEAVQQKYPGRLVGMYAYAGHSPPPSIDVHPNVVISVATAFIKGGFTVDQLIEGWQKRKATLGIREYYSVNTWDRDLPGRSRGSNLEYLAHTIPHFYENGARFLSAESSDNWGPNGLGYYLAARMLWNPAEAENLEELQEDFLQRAFGPAAGPMREFYQRMEGYAQPLLSEDLIGRMYRRLDEALQLAEGEEHSYIRARLNELVLYTRYVELYLAYSSASGPERQAAFEQLIRHTYRMRKTMLVHAKALYRDLYRRDKNIDIPEGATWEVAEDQNPWKSDKDFTAEELKTILREGIAANALLAFEPVEFSRELVSAAPLNLPEVSKTGSMGIFSRGVRNYWTVLTESPSTRKFTAAAGLIYQNRGASKLALYPVLEPEGKPVDRAEVPPDKEDHTIELKSEIDGLARLEVSDSSQGTKLSWEEGTPMTVESSMAEPAAFHGRWTLYFYVPKGTRQVGGFADGVGKLLDADGQAVFTFEATPGYFHVPVAKGQDGRLWSFSHCSGKRLLMTVPPFLARSGEELLLPREIVERDRPQ